MRGAEAARRGLLILDHGTRHAPAREALASLARRVAEARPEWVVEHAHMEIAEPGFEAGIDALVARGAHTIYIHLHFMGAGYHVRETIPALVEQARERHPRIAIETSDPLGHDPRIVELIVERVDRQSEPERQSAKE